MTSLPAGTTSSPRGLPLILPTPLRALVASSLLFYLLLSQNVLRILYNKCPSLMDPSLFSPTAFAEYFIYYSKYVHLG